MCDYSLEAFSSRPARVFERYVTTRFPTGCIGFVSPGDRRTAVCLPYDARLVLDGAPRPLQVALEIGPIAEATFVRLESGGPYRDGFRLDNGQLLSIQELGPGVGAIVTRLAVPAEAPAEPDSLHTDASGVLNF